MNRAIHYRPLLFIAALLLVIATQLFSQTDTTVYAVVEFMKVEPRKEAAYIKLEQKFWKPVHQERLKAGLITGWYLYAVRFPAGTNYEFNYVTVNFVNKFADLENPYTDKIFTKAHPKANLSAMMDKTLEARNMVRQYVWALLDRVQPTAPSSTPSRYVAIDYMKAKASGDQAYLDLEQKVWKPIHQLRVKAGTLNSWGLYALVFPGGTNCEFNYGTANSYKNFADLENPYPNEIFAKVLPSMSPSELESKTSATRDLVRSEVWELIDYVQ